MATKKITKSARARGERLAQMAFRELGNDPEALALLASVVRLLAKRSRRNRRR